MHNRLNPTGQETITSTLLEDEPDLIDLVAKFVARLPERLADIGGAANTQDWPTLKQQLHALKGLGANFGYPDISQLAEQTEDALSRRDYGDIAPLLERLNSLCQRVSVGDIDP